MRINHTYPIIIIIIIITIIIIIISYISFLLLYWGILFIKNKEYTLYIILYQKKYITITSTRSK